MNNRLFSLLLCLPVCLHGQKVDFVAVQQVDSLIQVSRALTDDQDFEGALAVNAIAEQIAVEKIGKETASFASTCFNHGRVFYFEGRYVEAEPWYIESKAIRGRVLGTDHLDYGKSLNNLAILYDEMSRYEEAEPLYLEAVALREKRLGKQSPEYAAALGNLASLYTSLGEYEKAEKLTLEAKDIRAQVLGKQHPDYASSLNNLANLYFSMGHYEKAEQLFLESKAIREAANDTPNAEFALILDNLGSLYQFMGKFDTGLKHLQSALDIRLETLGPEHPDYLLNLYHLADLYLSMGQYDKSAKLLFKVKEVGEKAGKNVDYALTLAKLAELYTEMGQYDKALPYSLEFKSMIEEFYGKTHIYYLNSVENLARTYWALGNIEAASPLFTEAATIGKHLMLKASHHLSERELAAFTQKFADRFNSDLSFAMRHRSFSDNCYNNLLFYKGFLLNAALQLGKLASCDTTISRQYNLFKSYHRQLAAEYAKPNDERSGVATLEEKANDLEKDLAQRTASLKRAFKQVDWQAVQASLKPNEAAIEFAHFQVVTPKATDSTMYVALIVKPDADRPELVPLFEEKQLARLLDKNHGTTTNYINDLYGSPSLYKLIWQPLTSSLEGVEVVYFAPTGLLHYLNIGAVFNPTANTLLADQYRLIQLSSTRELVFNRMSDSDKPLKAAETTTALLYGGIQFDMDSTALASNEPVLVHRNTSPNSTYNQNETGGPNIRANKWGFLKWTSVEVDAIEAILKDVGVLTEQLNGYHASEESFKAIGNSTHWEKSPHIIHFATHGFFFPQQKSKAGPLTHSYSGGEVFKTSDLTLMRSGLLLAGGNYAWQHGQTLRPGSEDGILTAYEISHADLSNTDLVVLSACETGLGELSSYEGVHGLQRAFKIAGAKHLIMSLWQVPDFQTQELMTLFYAHWQEGKMTIPEAFRLAQQAIRLKYKAPFFWAGFVLLS